MFGKPKDTAKEEIEAWLAQGGTITKGPTVFAVASEQAVRVVPPRVDKPEPPPVREGRLSRIEAARKREADQSPEQRSARIRKGWETRRRNTGSLADNRRVDFKAAGNGVTRAERSRPKLSLERRAEIEAALRVSRNASAVARVFTEVSRVYIWKIAKKAGIELNRGGRPRRKAPNQRVPKAETACWRIIAAMPEGRWISRAEIVNRAYPDVPGKYYDGGAAKAISQLAKDGCLEVQHEGRPKHLLRLTQKGVDTRIQMMHGSPARPAANQHVVPRRPVPSPGKVA